MSDAELALVPPGARQRGFALLFAAVMAWGIGWPVNKLLLNDLPPLWAVALRTIVAVVALFAILGWRRRLILPCRADLPVLLSITLLHMVGYAVLVSIALLFVPVGRSVVLAYTTPLWVMPGSALLLRERLTLRRVTGVAFGLLGLAVLFNPFAFDWQNRNGVLGNLLLLGAALLWAANILHIRGHRWRATPFDLLPWEMLVAAAILTTLAVPLAPLPAIHWRMSLVALLLYSALPGSILAFWAAAMASRSLPAVTTSLGLLGTPVIGVVASALWLGEAPTVSLAVAIVLIIGGVAIGATASDAKLGVAGTGRAATR